MVRGVVLLIAALALTNAITGSGRDTYANNELVQLLQGKQLSQVHSHTSGMYQKMLIAGKNGHKREKASSLTIRKGHSGEKASSLTIRNGHSGEKVSSLTIRNGHNRGKASSLTIRNGHSGEKAPSLTIRNGNGGENASRLTTRDVARTFPCVYKKSTERITVDCSHKNLTSVPNNIPEGATDLILAHNLIKTIPAGTFQNQTSLKTLDVSHNKLSRLDSGTFLGLNQLKTLLLNDNFLNMSATTFADDVFIPLSSLECLNLKSKVEPHNSEFQYPDVALSELASLKTLLINGLTDTTFGPGVRKLTSIRTLDLSDTPSFISLSKDTFTNFKHIKLRNLILSHCDLVFIHREAFFNLTYIDTIDYSYNRHLEIKGVAISSYGLQNSTIRKVVMQRVHAQPSLTVVTKEDAQYISNTQLEELDMSNNTIGQFMGVEPILLFPLSIKVLRISWNNIQCYKDQALWLMRFRSAEQFDASHQGGHGAKPLKVEDSTAHSENLIHLFKPKKSKKIDIFHLYFNSSKYLSFGKYKQSYFGNGLLTDINLPPKLWMINCSSTGIRYPIPALKFINSSLEYVNFAHNQLNRWEGPLIGVESIRHFDLTGNGCYSVSDLFFAYMTGIQTLLIGENNFRKTFQGEKTFYNLTALKHLDMHSSQLETLGYNLFSRLTNLTHLQLSQNYLSDWNINMSGLVRLQTLDLSHNKLRSLPRSLCQDLDNIEASSSVQVDIQDNPLQCVCDTEYFVEWLTTTKVRFRTLNSTFCTLTNGTVRSLSASRSILGHLQQDCRSYTALIGGLGGVLALVLTTVLAKIIHRQRWKLRYLWYMAANWKKRTGYQSLDSDGENPFGYDAFVSYEDSHKTFIREQIIARLETEAGLKLCIDKRDFVPGLYITHNILDAIQNSKKTVVLLSKAFLESNWCMYELNMARMEGIFSGRELLVLVLTEEIPVSQLSAEIIDVIHTQTYIEMTNNRYGEALFWERLTSAIKSD